MNDSNPVSDRVFQKAGSGLKEEINLDVRGKCRKYYYNVLFICISVFYLFYNMLSILECRTGEVRVTHGHSLPARNIIHTVGPKYNIKYQSAAENTLYTCYR